MLQTPAFKLRALLSAIVLASGAAFAAGSDDDYVVREHRFSVAELEEIEIHASVGSVELMASEDAEIHVILEIEANDDGWFDRRRDVSDVDLESDVRGARLVLEQTEKGTTTEWTIRMPALARTSIEMGVGDIDGELGATELDLRLGVGEVDLVLPEASTGAIDIEVGVGEARLRGADAVDHEQAFVSADVSGRGAGALAARIEVGVGDATLELE